MTESQQSTNESAVPRSEAFWLWLKVGLLSFGGPAGQISLMHRYVVDEKKWISDGRFLHALNYCMLLPGPEAQQLAVYIGWLLHGIRGSLVAGLWFVIPGAIVIYILSVLYALYSGLALVDGIFLGVKAAVLAIVLQAIIRLGSRVLKKPLLLGLAIFGFVATFFLHLPFPLVVLIAAVVGFTGGKVAPDAIKMDHGHGGDGEPEPVLEARSSRRTLMAAAIFAVLWVIPILVILATLGRGHVYTEESLFFSKLAIVTFGGAYAVLAYMTEQVVGHYSWLSTGQMIDGLGMAETTPGPLILVTQFVGFLAAFNNPGTLDPLVAGTLGALLTLWVTFVPCFLWIYVGAPFIEKLRGSTGLNDALSAITAVVVGVIASLALWFASHVLFAQTNKVGSGMFHFDLPVLSSVNIFALVVSVLAAIAMIKFKQPVLRVLLCAAVAGVIWRLSGL